MGNRVLKRVFAICLAMVLMVASSLAVMATETTSPGGGDDIPDPVVPSRTTSLVIRDSAINVQFTQKNAVKYIVEYKTTDGTWDHCKIKTASDLKAVLPNLVHGSQYDIRVKVVNEKGKVAYSVEANRFFRSCAAKVAANNKGGFTVKVDKALSRVGSGTKFQYKIYWSTDENFKKFNYKVVDGDKLSTTIAGKRGTTYYVRVVPLSVANGKTYSGVQNKTHEVKVK